MNVEDLVRQALGLAPDAPIPPGVRVRFAPPKRAYGSRYDDLTPSQQKLVRDSIGSRELQPGEQVTLRFLKAGCRRNKPCPCGSGKKAKHCCMGRIVYG